MTHHGSGDETEIGRHGPIQEVIFMDLKSRPKPAKPSGKPAWVSAKPSTPPRPTK